MFKAAGRSMFNAGGRSMFKGGCLSMFKGGGRGRSMSTLINFPGSLPPVLGSERLAFTCSPFR